VDTGLTLDYLLRKFAERHPRSIRICSLLDKKARRKNKLEITYCGFAIDDLFVVGYGMDCDQRYRALHHIAVLE
jgi:hypoxanthine phosphoribosyltransferase